MRPPPPQKELFACPPPTPGTVFVNDRVCIQTEEKQRVVFVHGVVFGLRSTCLRKLWTALLVRHFPLVERRDMVQGKVASRVDGDSSARLFH